MAGENAVDIDVKINDNLLVDAKTDRVIDDPYLFYTSRGYTRQENVSPCYDDCMSLHAEQNALMFSDRRLRVDGTIYVTSHVCFGCAKLVANSGLSTVAVPADTTLEAAHRKPERSYEFLESCGIEVITV